MAKNRLEQIRLQMGYKFAKDFAKFLGFEPNQYNPWALNHKQPNADNILKILDKLNMKFEDVFYSDEPK